MYDFLVFEGGFDVLWLILKFDKFIDKLSILDLEGKFSRGFIGFFL